MANTGVEYTVKKGDTLWDIAQEKLGSGEEWPRIYAFNNRSNILKLGGKRIANPDLIYPGDIIRLPIHFASAVERSAANSNSASSRENTAVKTDINLSNDIKRRRYPVTYGYKLEKVPVSTTKIPGFVVKARMEGSIFLSSLDKVPLAYIGNDMMIKSIKLKSDIIAEKLISNFSFAFDHKTKSISVKNMLVIKSSNKDYTSKVSFGPQLSNRGISFAAEVYYPNIKGQIDGWKFVGSNVKFVFEITPDNSINTPTTIPISPPVSSPYFRPSVKTPEVPWKTIFVVGLVGVAFALSSPAVIAAGVLLLFIDFTQTSNHMLDTYPHPGMEELKH